MSVPIHPSRMNRRARRGAPVLARDVAPSTRRWFGRSRRPRVRPAPGALRAAWHNMLDLTDPAAPETVARTQGLCYVLMGMWPLTHMASLEQLTGPKHDVWLMQVAGALLTVVGLVLMLGSRRRMASTVPLLGLGIAGVLALLAVAFVMLGHISRVYLIDAMFEAVFIGWWAFAAIRTRPSRRVQAVTVAVPEPQYTNFFDRSQRHTLH